MKLIDKIQRQLDANHYIEAEDIQKLIDAQKWIAVEDKLPEYGMEVLILFGDGEIRMAEMSSDMGGNKNWQKVPSWIGAGRWSIDNTTHWKPLPEPPTV